jgi:hypothetical protein
VNVKGIEVTLVARARADALLRGQTLTEWVREAMEGRLGDVPTGTAVFFTPQPEVEIPLPPSSESGPSGSVRVTGVDTGRNVVTYESEEEGVPNCPDDGDPMIWNRVLKRYECRCGYKGKVLRGDI